MTEVKQRATVLASDQDPQEQPYRSLSQSAIAALILGLLSVVALLHPVLWSVPMTAAALSLLALFNIRRRAELTGHRMATAALLLAALFGTCAPTRHFVRKQLILRDARKYSLQWLEMVRQNRLDDAYQLRLPYYERKAPDQTYKQFYAQNPDVEYAVTHGFKESPLKEIIAAGETGRFTFVANVDCSRIARDDYATLRYRLDDAKRAAPLLIHITLKRSYVKPLREFHWQLHDIFIPDSME